MERLYVIGHPVAHSKSPAMHDAAYRALGLDWEYGFEDCATVDEARAFLERGEWIACNVTMPYKPIAYEVAVARSIAAMLARGANVLVKSPVGLLADNTDGIGCKNYLERCGVSLAGVQVVVCGTGPTSRAVMHACAAAGAASVCLVSRDAGRAQRAVEQYRAALGQVAGKPAEAFAFDGPDSLEAVSRITGNVKLAGLSYEAGEEAIASADIIVDATSLGMDSGDPAPFDVSLLSSGQVVLDVVYGHGESALLAAARAKGCAAFDGEGMLVAQAVETVRDIAQATGRFEIPPSLDLFAIMARAAGFGL